MSEQEYYTLDLDAKLERNDEFLRALGDVTYNSAWLEGVLSGLVADMNGGTCSNTLLAEMSFNNTLNVARAVADTVLPQGMYRRYFYAVCALAQQAYDLRNRVVHSMWFGVEGTTTEFVALRYRVKGKWVRHENVVGLDLLREIADDIANVAARFARFADCPAFRERRMFVVCGHCGHHV